MNNDFWVTRGAIYQWFSLVTSSLVKIIGKSPHSWPKSRYSRQFMHHSLYHEQDPIWSFATQFLSELRYFQSNILFEIWSTGLCVQPCHLFPYLHPAETFLSTCVCVWKMEISVSRVLNEWQMCGSDDKNDYSMSISPHHLGRFQWIGITVLIRRACPLTLVISSRK